MELKKNLRWITLCFELLIAVVIVTAVGCSVPARPVPDCGARFPRATFLEQANRLRKDEEIEPLTPDVMLMQQALSWAEYNARQEQRTHYDSEGRGPLERLKIAGLARRMVAENIATAPASIGVDRVLGSWKGKREGDNLLQPLYRMVGYGVANASTGCVIVLILTE